MEARSNACFDGFELLDGLSPTKVAVDHSRQDGLESTEHRRQTERNRNLDRIVANGGKTDLSLERPRTPQDSNLDHSRRYGSVS